MTVLARLVLLVSLLLAPVAASAQTILFIGNSFTFGALSPVQYYRPASVHDLNGYGVGGVPALFKAFTEQAGLDYAVHHELSGGKTLRWHYEKQGALLDRYWDTVVLQEYSTLNPEAPGDPAQTLTYAGRLAELFRKRNPRVALHLAATWSRPDLTYRGTSRWSGKSIEAMATDLRTATDRVAASVKAKSVVPVGTAFSAAVTAGVADGNPYDGIAFGQVDLWGADHYHGSTFGYYLEALLVFGRVTGRAPTSLGAGERAARELGMTGEQAVALQKIAEATLAN